MDRTRGESTGLMGGIAFGILSAGSQRALDFLMRLLAARLLGVGPFGVLSIGLSLFFPLSTIMMLGLRVGIVQAIARTSSRYDSEAASKQSLLAGALIVVPVGLVTSLLGYHFSSGLARLFSKEPSFQPLAHILILGFVPYLLSQLLVAGLVGRHDMKGVFQVSVVERGTILVSFLALYSFGVGLPAAASCYPIGITAGLLMLGWRLSPATIWASQITSLRTLFREMAKTLKFSLPVWASDSLLMSRRHIDLLILASFLTEVEAGTYASATLLAGAFLVPLFGAERVILARASNLVTLRRKDELVRVYRKSARWLFCWGGMAFCVVSSVPAEIIKAGFGAEYLAGQTALIILVFGVWVNTATATQGSLNYAFGNSGLIAVGSALGFISALFLSLILIPRIGLTGAALASTISLVLSEGVPLFHLYRKYGFHPFQTAHLAIMGAVLAAWTLVRITRPLFGSSPWTCIICAGIVIVGVFSLIVLASPTLSRDAKSTLRALARLD